MSGFKTDYLLYRVGLREQERLDSREAELKKRQKWMEGGIITRRWHFCVSVCVCVCVCGRGCPLLGEERCSFGTVNNSPCLSWMPFTAAFVCSDILGSLKRQECLRGLSSQVFLWPGKGCVLTQYEYEGKGNLPTCTPGSLSQANPHKVSPRHTQHHVCVRACMCVCVSSLHWWQSRMDYSLFVTIYLKLHFNAQERLLLFVFIVQFWTQLVCLRAAWVKVRWLITPNRT